MPVKKKKAQVKFDGDLTLFRSLSFKEELERALKSPQVEVSFGEVGEVDLSFVQVLVAARKSASRDGKELAVRRENFPPALEDLVREAGLDRGGESVKGLWRDVSTGPKGEE